MDQLKTEIAVLQEISSAVVHERNVSRLLDRVLDILNRKMGMVRGTFTLRQGDLFIIEASQGLDENEKKRGRYKLGEGITGHVAETGVPCLVPDISKDKRFLSRTGKHQFDSNPVAFLCVPVIQDERVIATLGIDRKVVPGVQLDEDLKLLEIIGNLMADAVAVYHQEREERESLLEENKRLREALTEGGNPGELIGNCRAMQNIYALIRQAQQHAADTVPGTGMAVITDVGI